MLAILAAIATLGSAPHPMQSKAPLPPQSVKVATLCFFKSEETSGMNKICYYDCLGSLTAITIGAVQLCPLSINR